MKNIVLIGGAPTTGKSFLAGKISEQLKIPWISTDDIRELMRKIVNPKDFPELSRFTYEEGAAEKYLTSHTPQQIVEDQNLESEDVWRGVLAFVEAGYVWKTYIIEGVAITPKNVSQINLPKTKIKSYFLVDNDVERIKKVVFTRGLWDDAETYPDYVKEKEVEWALLYSKWLKREARKYNLTAVEINKHKKYIEEITIDITNWLTQ